MKQHLAKKKKEKEKRLACSRALFCPPSILAVQPAQEISADADM